MFDTPLPQCQKTKKRPVSWLLILLLTLGLYPHRAAAQLPDTLELDQLLELASQRALGSEAAARDRQLAELDYRIFRAGLLPQLTGFANFPNYNKTFQEITQDDGTVRFQPVRNNNSSVGLQLEQQIPYTGGTLFVRSNLQRFDDFETDFTLYNGLPFRVGLIQPIFAFNPVKWDRKLEPLRLSEAQQQFSADLETVRTDATELYFNWLVAVQERNIAQTNLAANQRLFGIAEERFELGQISKRDLIQLELEMVSAERSRLRAEQSVREAAAGVATYLGFDPTATEFAPKEPAPPSVTDLTEARALTWARQNRPEWTGFARRVLEAERAVDRARKTNGPELNLTASFGKVRSGNELTEVYVNPLPEEFVQLQLSLPILDWGQRRMQTQQAAADLDFTRTAVDREALNFENDVRQTVRDFRTLEQELTMARRIRDLSEERFRITTESYVLGAIPLSELTLAQREKDQAARTYITTLQAYWFAYADLRRLTLHNL
jgi:outer membrane protein TolC